MVFLWFNLTNHRNPVLLCHSDFIGITSWIWQEWSNKNTQKITRINQMWSLVLIRNGKDWVYPPFWPDINIYWVKYKDCWMEVIWKCFKILYGKQQKNMEKKKVWRHCKEPRFLHLLHILFCLFRQMQAAFNGKFEKWFNGSFFITRGESAVVN